MRADALKDRTVVVIGGTTGLGLSAVKACLEEGASVVAVGRNPRNVRAVAELGDRVRAMEGDATDPETAPAAVARALECFGRFDGLYHVAGGSGRSAGDGPLDSMTDAGLDFTLRLNLVSLIYSNRAAVRDFLRRKVPGSILNMSSTLAFSPSPRHFATHAYAASKAAVIGLTRAAAAYYASSDIRFNVLAPALIETAMSRRAQEDPEIRSYIRRKQPLDGGRPGMPRDADALVVYLLSDASRFVTGQVVAVDGGWSVTEAVEPREGHS